MVGPKSLRVQRCSVFFFVFSIRPIKREQPPCRFAVVHELTIMTMPSSEIRERPTISWGLATLISTLAVYGPFVVEAIYASVEDYRNYIKPMSLDVSSRSTVSLPCDLNSEDCSVVSPTNIRVCLPRPSFAFCRLPQ